MGFSGSGRVASPSGGKERKEAKKSDDSDESTLSAKSGSPRRSSSRMALGSAVEIKAPTSPLLVALLEATQEGVFHTGSVTKTVFQQWVQSFGTEPELVTNLEREGLLVSSSDSVRVVGADSLSMAENVAVFRLWQSVAHTDNFRVLEALLSTAYRNDRTSFAPAVLSLLSEEQLLQLVQRLVVKRLTDTTNSGELFRTDGSDTALLFEWAKRSCCEFVGAVLGPTVNHILQMAPAFEVDVKYLQYPYMRDGNLVHIRRLCEQLFSSLSDESDAIARFKVPPLMQHFARCVNAETRRKFSSAAGEIAVMAFAVLRMLSPAIIFPEKFGLCNYAPSSVQRHSLLTFAKVLQGIANGDKLSEPLTECSDLVSTFHEHLKKFLIRLLIGNDDTPPPELSSALTPARKHALATCLCELGREGLTICKSKISGGNGAAVSDSAVSCRDASSAEERFLFRCSFAAKMADEITTCAAEKDRSSEVASSDDTNVSQHLVKAHEIAQRLGNAELTCHLQALLQAGNSFGAGVFQMHRDAKPAAAGSLESDESKSSRNAAVLKTIFQPK